MLGHGARKETRHIRHEKYAHKKANGRAKGRAAHWHATTPPQSTSSGNEIAEHEPSGKRQSEAQVAWKYYQLNMK